MKLGVFITIPRRAEDINEEFRKVADLGMKCCQLNCWDINMLCDQTAVEVKRASAEFSIEITSFWCGWDGPQVWDFYEGPVTLGLLPPAYRHNRLNMLMAGSDFAGSIGVKNLITHAGFIPENPNDPEYRPLVAALRSLAKFCENNDQRFLFETGQETPVTLLRCIEDIGLSNLGVNLDPANLILYGKGNPVDALDVIGRFVCGVHAKDGVYPVCGKYIGKEVPVGQGKVDFPRLIARLRELGYVGPLTIEREISGEQQVKDIQLARDYLLKLI